MVAVDSFGPEDVSEHGFIRAAKLLKINNSTLPKACAQRSGAHRINVFPQPSSVVPKRLDENQFLAIWDELVTHPR